MKTDRHKANPITFRPSPEGNRARLLAYAKRTSQPVGRILNDALTAYLDTAEKSTANGTNRPTEG